MNHTRSGARRPLSARAGGVLLAAVLALTACQASDDATAPDPVSSVGTVGTDKGTGTDKEGGADAGDSTPAGGAYAAQFEQARQAATSDFERDVLADDEITRAEYEEAFQRYVDCMAGKGIAVGLYDQGGQYFVSVAAEDDEAFQREESEEGGGCVEGTTALISPLYVQILTNPNQEDHTELIVACLIDLGLADPSFTAEQWEELTAQGQNAQWPFDKEDHRFSACLLNPSNPQP